MRQHPLAVLRNRDGSVPGQYSASLAATSYSDGAVTVDVDAGIIKNVAIITQGDAPGHGFSIDQQTVKMIAGFLNAAPDGVKSRFRHPPVTTQTDARGEPVSQKIGDDTGSMVGRIRNGRLVANRGPNGQPIEQCRADVFLGDYASNLPGQGDVRGYILKMAQSDPAGIGLSCFFPYELDPVVDNFGNVTSLPARPLALDACDFVSVAGGNPHGLLSATAPSTGYPTPASDSDDDDDDDDDDDLFTELSGWDDAALSLLCDTGDRAGQRDAVLSDDDIAAIAKTASRLSPRQVSIVRATSAGATTFHQTARAIRASRGGPTNGALGAHPDLVLIQA